jgi:hemoglobin
MCQQTTTPLATLPVTPVAPEAGGHACACGGHGHAASARPEVGRRVAPSHDLDMPEVPFPMPRVLATVGADALRNLVHRHHTLLRQSEIGHLFEADDATFATLVERIADYVVESCGGPTAYTEAHGHACMRTRHFPFTIDERGREVWLEKLVQAITETDFPEAAREEYWAWLEAMSIRMINRRTTKAQPARLPYAEALARFTSGI